MSFKRKPSSKQVLSYPGTRISLISPSTIITSTGIPSLDDVLGGGLPLTCTQLILAPDPHTAYGELVQKYFIAQGIAWGHRVCVVADNAETLVKESMWIQDSSSAGSASNTADHKDDDNTDNQETGKIKIAWRYERMKQFQTTVSSTSSAPGAEDLCRTLDLTRRIPESVVEACRQNGQLLHLDTGHSKEERSTTRIIRQVTETLQGTSTGTSSLTFPVRIVISSLGSPQWGELKGEDIIYFLHSLRALARKHPNMCASISLSAHVSTDAWGGAGWTQKLGWVSDAAITLSAFSANPSLSSTFPSHHGLLHIHALPAPHTVLPPSDKFSTLRGLSSSAGSAGGGENNLAFKYTRKRLVIETLHLDVEGGVGERRTTPSVNAIAVGAETTRDAIPTMHGGHGAASKLSVATMEVGLEGASPDVVQLGVVAEETSIAREKLKRPKKKVAFYSERPDLYDF